MNSNYNSNFSEGNDYNQEYCYRRNSVNDSNNSNINETDGNKRPGNNDYDSYNTYNSYNYTARHNENNTTTTKPNDIISQPNNYESYTRLNSGYIPPKKYHKIDYTKEFPSNSEADNESYKPSKKEFNYEYNQYTDTIDDYEYETTQREKVDKTNHKIAINKQDTIEYSSVYESDMNYFITGCDPK